MNKLAYVKFCCRIFALMLVLGATGNALAQTETRLLASDGDSFDGFGVNVSIDGDVALVGASADDDNGDISGSAYVFRWDGANWVEEQKLLPSDGQSGDRFGGFVSIHGDVAVVGTLVEAAIRPNTPGAAYVFRWDGSSWVEEQKLIAIDGVGQNNFGIVSTDGTNIIVGAPNADNGAGAAYAYREGGICTDAWCFVGKIDANDRFEGAFFGTDVFVDDGLAVITSRNTDPDYVPNVQPQGAAYIFELVGFQTGFFQWRQLDRLVAWDGNPEQDLGSRFGSSVSISPPPRQLVVGAPGDRGCGAVYVFSQRFDWIADGKLSPTCDESHEFGWDVDIDPVSRLVAIGARGTGRAIRSDGLPRDAGSVYVFSRDSSGSWVEDVNILLPVIVPDIEDPRYFREHFGRSVEIDERKMLAGAPRRHIEGSLLTLGAAYVYDFGALDEDGDGVPENEDNCPGVSNPDQLDTDGDGVGDACDTDDDGDGIPDTDDNCSLTSNTDQTDNDSDGIGDFCDDDDDNDSVPDVSDNCPLIANANQLDLDGDGLGDVCDGDTDGDGVANDIDNCPLSANTDQTDTDSDGVGDECDADDDNDGLLDADDNCPSVPNQDQEDLDGDGIGDVCDADLDGDGVLNAVDNCPVVPNVGQDDSDFDGAGDACDTDDDNDNVLDADDNCPLIFNPDQTDSDGDGLGDVCDADLDGDGVANAIDNCPTIANSSQSDIDGDAIGDACDLDIDGDAVPNDLDYCAMTPIGDLIDPENGCSIEQLCPCDGPRGTVMPWKNHGKYVSCTAHATNGFVDKGLISQAEKDAIMSIAGQSSCGKKK